MAIQITGRVVNARKIQKMFREMARELEAKDARSVMASSARKTAKPMLDELRAQTPTETGSLRRSARLSVRARKNGFLARVGWRIRRLAGEGRAARRARYQQALGIEFGNKRTPEHRVLRAIADRWRDRVRGDFARHFEHDFYRKLREVATRNRLRVRRGRGRARR